MSRTLADMRRAAAELEGLASPPPGTEGFVAQLRLALADLLHDLRELPGHTPLGCDAVTAVARVPGGSWLAGWSLLRDAAPAAFERVVVESSGGVLSVDWTEPCGDPPALCFSENHGPVVRWMPEAAFFRTAPDWARGRVEPVDPDAEARRVAKRDGQNIPVD